MSLSGSAQTYYLSCGMISENMTHKNYLNSSPILFISLERVRLLFHNLILTAVLLLSLSKKFDIFSFLRALMSST